MDVGLRGGVGRKRTGRLTFDLYESAREDFPLCLIFF